MTTVRLRSVLFALPLALPLFAACHTGVSSSEGGHWTVDSVPNRMVKHFTGYRADRDGRFVDHQYREKRQINTTLRRHFGANDPDNPFMSDDPSQTARRPPHSIWPDPLYYMGAESVVVGAVMMGLTGAFIPIPIDSLVATGIDAKESIGTDKDSEFWDGFSGGNDALKPPPVRDFRVKNR